MNFYITVDRNYDNRFNLHKVSHKQFDIYIDQNWDISDSILQKGTTNNFCKITLGDNLKIQTNQLRDFPLWHDKSSASNFEELENVVPSDGELSYDNNWQIQYSDFYQDLVQPSDPVTFVKDILLENTAKFLDNNKLPILVPKNNGVDTLLARSLLDQLGAKYSLIDIQKKKYLPLQSHLEKKFYGFNQLEELDAPSVIVSGFYGDEFMLRNPFYLQSMGIDTATEFDSNPTCYMKKFYDLVYRTKCSTVTTVPIKKVCEMICNDQQVWHINNTMMWTPFKDKRLLNLLLCDEKAIIGQMTNATLSKTLIKQLNPILYEQIDQYKNSNDPAWFWQADPVKEKFIYENNNRFDEHDDLYKASWIINNFAYELAPLVPAQDSDIDTFINQLQISELRKQQDITQLGKRTVEWINKSKRLGLQNFNLPFVNVFNGVDFAIESFINRHRNIGYLANSYYAVKDHCEANDISHYQVDDKIIENTGVILELPSVKYNTKQLISLIKDCKKANCTVALDLTFLPIYVGERIDIDVSQVDELWFSMNKAWPIKDIRTALRFSKSDISDMQSYSHKKQAQNNIGASVFSNCIDNFSFDYTHDKHITTVEHLCKKFNVSMSNNLWLAKRPGTVWSHMPSKNWNYDDLIGLHSLINNKDKYFW